MDQQLQALLQNPVVKGLAASCSDRLLEYKNKQRRIQLQVLLNRNMVNGYQWAVLLSNSNELYEPLQDEGEVRMTSNIIKPIVNVMRAETLARRLSWHVEAYNGDETKIQAASVMTQILQQYFFAFERSGQLGELIDGLNIDGVVYMAVDYWPDKGAIIDQDPATGEVVKEGRIVPRLVSTLDVLVPDNYPDLNKAPCVIEVCRMHQTEAQKRWNLPDEPGPSSVDERRMDDLAWGTERDKDKQVCVYKMHFKPGNGALPDDGQFPDGLTLVYIQTINKVVEVLPFPYPFNELGIYPLIDFHCDRRHERYHSQGIPEQLIPIQVERNRTFSQILESKNFIGNPMFRAARGQFNDVDDIPTQPGSILFYNPLPGISPPDTLQPPAIPAYIQEVPAVLANEARNVYSTSEIAQAQQPGSINSYSGLQLLSNIQAKVMTPYLQDYANKWSLVGKVLGLMEQRYTDYNKQLRVTDDVGDMQLQSFYTGADLLNDFDVIVRVEPEVESAALKKQTALQELQMGAIDAAEYKRRIYGEQSDESYKMEMWKHQAENQRMMAGEVIDNLPMAAFENHQVGFDVVMKLINNPTFMQLPPQLQEGIKRHAYVHFVGINQPQMLMQSVVQPALTQLGIMPQQPMMPQGAETATPEAAGGAKPPMPPQPPPMQGQAQGIPNA